MTFTLNFKPFHRKISFDSDMEIDEDTGGGDVVAQDPPVQDDHLEKNSHKKKKKTKEEIKDEKRELHRQALEAFKQGQYPSVNSCASAYNISRKTLGRMIESNRDFIGGGRKSRIFTTEEEAKLVSFVSHRMSLGCGLDFSQLSLVIQELAIAVKSSNKDREFPSTWEELFPPQPYVRTFIRRNNLVLRSTLNLNLARAVLTVVDLKKWFDDLYKGFV